MGILERYRQLTQQANQPPQQTGSLQTVTPNDNQQEIPAFDTSNAIQSFAQLMGPTPAEREAEERRLANNKAKMNAWMGLFNGLGALGQLYGATKGASYAPMTANPHQQIEQNYQQELGRLDRFYKNRQAYAQQLYNWQRQANEDKRKEKLADAQAQWYGTRDELARLKADNDRLRAEQQASVNEARRKQIELKTKQMEELHPLQKQKIQATIKNTLHNANRPYGGGRRGGGRSSSSDPFEELATQLNDEPDIIGPILEQEGLGFYNKDTKEFNFSKNATKGMATTATRRAATQRSSTQRQSGSSRQTETPKKKTTGTKRKSKTTI